jgi:ribosome biogenesis GTPase / thiamine phosphate phosphatase
MDKLSDFGWDDTWAAEAMPANRAPARVTADFGSTLTIVAPQERTAILSGKLMHTSVTADLPKVGDWVQVQLIGAHEAVIERVLPRRNEIARHAAGEKATKQIMAANVDIAFVLQSLDKDFSPERLQRYLYQLSVSNITPVVVLTKADMMPDTEPYIKQVEALHVPCLICSATTGAGVDEIAARITPGHTAVLLGSSGVGKSTLTNRLLGREAQQTKAVSAIDGTGVHTTIHRELFVLPNGGLLIDMPGIRELQLWGDEDELDEPLEHTERNDANYQKMKGELQELAVKTAQQAERQNKRRIAPRSRRANKQLDSDDLDELG